jgi:hypothetical protein
LKNWKLEIENQETRHVSRPSTIAHRPYPTTDLVTFTWWRLLNACPKLTRRLLDAYSPLTRRLPDGCQPPHTTTYTINYNNISFHWLTFIHIFGSTVAVSAPGKWKANKQKNKKSKIIIIKTKQVRPCGDRTLDIQPMTQHMASILHGAGYSTLTRRLPDGCQPPHTTTYTIIQPYLWLNSNCAPAREVKNKKVKK